MLHGAEEPLWTEQPTTPPGRSDPRETLRMFPVQRHTHGSSEPLELDASLLPRPTLRGGHRRLHVHTVESSGVTLPEWNTLRRPRGAGGRLYHQQ